MAVGRRDRRQSAVNTWLHECDALEVSRTDWNMFWRFEGFRRECDPLDFRRWKRDSQRYLREGHPGTQRLLDATAGMGDHTVNLAELGFDVEATDTSAVAREFTRASIAKAALDVPVHDVPWRSLGDAFPKRFDLIFNDALHWVEDPEELLAACRGMHDALRPGGALVFFFADAGSPEPNAGLELLAWDWKRTEPRRHAWTHERDSLQVSLDVESRLDGTVIEETHHFTVSPEGRAGFESTSITMRRIYRWDWAAIVPLLHEAGFADVRSASYRNVEKGYSFAMNEAIRAG